MSLAFRWTDQRNSRSQPKSRSSPPSMRRTHQRSSMLPKSPFRRARGVQSDFELRTAEVPGDPDLVIAPATAEAPRRLTESEPAFRFTGSESETERDNGAQFPVDRAPFERLSGALEPTRSAVWPLGLALILGVSFGFAAGYEVASWQRQAGAARVAAPAPASAAQATSGRSVREFSESAVREPAAAATPGTPATRVSLTPNAPNAARPPAGAPVAASTPAAAGRLLIRSTPAGARVVLDGRDVGETPLTLRGVTRGAHTVRVARDGYVAEQRRVVVSAASPAQSLTIALARRGSRGTVHSVQARAAGGRAQRPVAAGRRERVLGRQVDRHDSAPGG